MDAPFRSVSMSVATGTASDIVGVLIVGAGERGIYFLGTRMAELAVETGFRIIGVHDRVPERAVYAAQHLNQLYQQLGIDHTVQIFNHLSEGIHHSGVHLVLVTTHTNAHKIPVQEAIDAGKRVYLDKPIAVSLDDAIAIEAAELRSGKPIMMGFTRRYETPWVEAVKLAHSGEIGSLQMILLRSVIPYSRYMQLWHRNSNLSGGAINDKCSHHFDVLTWVAQSTPVSVTAMGGRSDVFKPDPDAPARCSECDRTCPYRRHETLADQHEGVGSAANPSWQSASRIEDRNDNCVYLPGADIDDHAVVTVRYKNGITACLFFTLFGPWAEDQETLEIVGSSGRLRLERHSGSIDVIADYGHQQRTVHCSSADRESSHFGADLELIRTLRKFYDGEAPPVGVAEGVNSLRLVLAAQHSLQRQGELVSTEIAS